MRRQKVGAGCAGQGRDASTVAIDPRQVQAANMSFADRYLAAMADEYDRVTLAAKTPDATVLAQRLKILAGTGAMGNAVDPNPVVGLMDMALMVTLTRQIAEDGWVGETFSPATADAMVATLKVQEADVWRIAGTYLTSAQVEELRQLAAQWRQKHPGQRYIAGARLADFAEAKRPAVVGGPADPVAQVAGSALGLVSLDPFHGLDPALKEVEESRVLAERLFFYMRHAPILMTWQADSLFDQMLAQPQMVQLFADTTTVAGSTTRFSDATTRFSDASNAVAQTVEKFRLQLPDQQARLVAELDDLVARQRAGALAQATTQVSVERDATLRQFQGVGNESIDRVYRRARALVLITVGSILLAFILYRRLAVPRTRKTATG
jgi:hypothetical protein